MAKKPSQIEAVILGTKHLIIKARDVTARMMLNITHSSACMQRQDSGLIS